MAATVCGSGTCAENVEYAAQAATTPARPKPLKAMKTDRTIRLARLLPDRDRREYRAAAALRRRLNATFLALDLRNLGLLGCEGDGKGRPLTNDAGCET
jgi:hypothetical protein